MRGSLHELVTHFTATEPRGEIVVVVEGRDLKEEKKQEKEEKKNKYRNKQKEL